MKSTLLALVLLLVPVLVYSDPPSVPQGVKTYPEMIQVEVQHTAMCHYHGSARSYCNSSPTDPCYVRPVGSKFYLFRYEGKTEILKGVCKEISVERRLGT